MTTNHLITVAEALCKTHHFKLTAARKQVLMLIAGRKGLIKAYDLLSDLKKIKPNATPMEIYRSLDFLGHIGLLHKVDALNGFIVCSEPHGHAHFCLMLVCEKCGDIEELHDKNSLAPLIDLLFFYKFKPSGKSLVVNGCCESCLLA